MCFKHNGNDIYIALCFVVSVETGSLASVEGTRDANDVTDMHGLLSIGTLYLTRHVCAQVAKSLRLY